MSGIETTKVRESFTEDGRVVITDKYVDGDLFLTKEEYFDNDGYLIYEYVHDKTPGQLLKAIKEKEQPKKTQPNKQHQDKLNKKLNKNRRRG